MELNKKQKVKKVLKKFFVSLSLVVVLVGLAFTAGQIYTVSIVWNFDITVEKRSEQYAVDEKPREVKVLQGRQRDIDGSEFIVVSSLPPEPVKEDVFAECEAQGGC